MNCLLLGEVYKSLFFVLLQQICNVLLRYSIKLNRFSISEIVDKREWLWESRAKFKEATEDTKIYVARSTTLHNLLFCAHTLYINYVTNNVGIG